MRTVRYSPIMTVIIRLNKRIPVYLDTLRKVSSATLFVLTTGPAGVDKVLVVSAIVSTLS
jgi:hypothetical protein